MGTLVRIRVAGLPVPQAHAAIDAAFTVIGGIHARMSFQDPGSDVSRLNRAPAGTRVRVDAETADVLALTERIFRLSGGIFDPTVAGDLVRTGRLPAPADARLPDPRACWDDIEREGNEVCLHRPLWLDLSGIAKGHAVDRAVAILTASGASEVCVEAGGDLRLAGPPRQIMLRTGFIDEMLPVIDIERGSVASSGGRPDMRHAADGQHWHGGTREPAKSGRFACVIAETCAVADALTKVVLALGRGSGAILGRFAAAGHLRDTDGHWHGMGGSL